jgi:hypothetical protein
LLHDLDASLRSLLGHDGAPEPLRAADVSFDTPDKDFAPSQPTVNLFLHEVLENRGLRDPAPFYERIGDQVVSRAAPLRVDCSYLTTAWSAGTGGLKAEEEHRLLGLTLLWLSRFPVLDPFLQGSLADQAAPYRVPMVVAQTREGEQLGQFWSALGVPPRPAFSLTVTIGLQPLPDPDRYPPPTAVQLETSLRDTPALTGRVLDPVRQPIGGAEVAVLPTDEVATTAADGRFRFPELPFGSYTIRVRVPGRADVSVPVSYQTDRRVHDAIVPQP